MREHDVESVTSDRVIKGWRVTWRRKKIINAGRLTAEAVHPKLRESESGSDTHDC